MKMNNIFKMNAVLLGGLIGDTFVEHILFSTLKNQFKNAYLTVLYPGRFEYKSQIAKLNPYIDKEVIRHGLFYLNGITSDNLYTDLGFCDYLYHISAFRQSECLEVKAGLDWRVLAGMENRAYLKFPHALEEKYNKKLIELGVDPNHWFVCFHARETGYNDKCSRDTDPWAYYEMAKYIINELGGQAVRLGDETMTDFPETEGLIDLRHVNDFLFHTYAVSKSRFIVVSDSAWHPAGSALNVPTAVTNLYSVAFPWNEHDAILTKKLILKDGRELSQGDFADLNFIMPYLYLDKTVSYKNNNAEQLSKTAKRMYDKTMEQKGWRTFVEPVYTSYKNKLELPLKPAINAEFIDVS